MKQERNLSSVEAQRKRQCFLEILIKNKDTGFSHACLYFSNNLSGVWSFRFLPRAEVQKEGSCWSWFSSFCCGKRNRPQQENRNADEQKKQVERKKKRKGLSPRTLKTQIFWWKQHDSWMFWAFLLRSFHGALHSKWKISCWQVWLVKVTFSRLQTKELEKSLPWKRSVKRLQKEVLLCLFFADLRKGAKWFVPHQELVDTAIPRGGIQ